MTPEYADNVSGSELINETLQAAYEARSGVFALLTSTILFINLPIVLQELLYRIIQLLQCPSAQPSAYMGFDRVIEA